jgi:hypothetical protein
VVAVLRQPPILTALVSGSGSLEQPETVSDDSSDECAPVARVRKSDKTRDVKTVANILHEDKLDIDGQPLRNKKKEIVQVVVYECTICM